jgi:hypothetical protein
LDPEPDLETPLNSTMRFPRQKISFANKILVYGAPKVDGGWKNFEFCEVFNKVFEIYTFSFRSNLISKKSDKYGSL